MSLASWLRKQKKTIVRKYQVLHDSDTWVDIFEKSETYLRFLIDAPNLAINAVTSWLIIRSSLNMIVLFINDVVVELTNEQQSYIMKELEGRNNHVYDSLDPRPNNGLPHSCLCDYLKVGRFAPATFHKPYAIQTTRISIYKDKMIIGEFGGKYQCAFCCFDVTKKPVGRSCPQCGNSKLTNLSKGE